MRRLSPYSNDVRHFSKKSLVDNPARVTIYRDPVEGITFVYGEVDVSTKGILAIGTARKHPKDKWVEEIGDALALARYHETVAKVLFQQAEALIK